MPRPQGLPKTGGRQKGTPNKRTQQILDQAAAEGITPLEVQLRTMRMLWEKAHEGSVPDLELAKQACAVAAQCAPYCHPRLAAVEARVDARLAADPISFEQHKQRALRDLKEAFREYEIPDHRPQGVIGPPVIEHEGRRSGAGDEPAR